MAAPTGQLTSLLSATLFAKRILMSSDGNSLQQEDLTLRSWASQHEIVPPFLPAVGPNDLGTALFVAGIWVVNRFPAPRLHRAECPPFEREAAFCDGEHQKSLSLLNKS
jgi:hypothetical protein